MNESKVKAEKHLDVFDLYKMREGKDKSRDREHHDIATLSGSM